ncbi:putative Thioesterase domain, HotDog domain superfamily, acyl-coenzyme A thioesterase 13 [Helianthus anomalus]
MDFEWVKNYLEKTSTSGASSNDIDSTPSKLFEAIIMWGLKLDRIDRGRVVCSMKLPPRLLVSLFFCNFGESYKSIFCSVTISSCFEIMELKNVDSSLHGGATAALVDVMGGLAIRTVTNMTTTGVSMEINVSYLDASYVGVYILHQSLTVYGCVYIHFL